MVAFFGWLPRMPMVEEVVLTMFLPRSSMTRRIQPVDPASTHLAGEGLSGRSGSAPKFCSGAAVCGQYKVSTGSPPRRSGTFLTTTRVGGYDGWSQFTDNRGGSSDISASQFQPLPLACDLDRDSVRNDRALNFVTYSTRCCGLVECRKTHSSLTRDPKITR